MSNKKNIFSLADKFDYKSPFEDWQDTGDENYLYDLKLRTEKLMGFMKNGVDRRSTKELFNYEDFLDTSPKYVPLNPPIISPDYSPLPADDFFPIELPIKLFQSQERKYYYKVLLTEGVTVPTIYNIQMGIIVNSIYGPVDFTNPYTNICFEPESRTLRYAIAFNYTGTKSAKYLAIILTFDDFEQFAILLNFFNNRWLVDSFRYARFQNVFLRALAGAKNTPSKLAWLYSVAPKLFLYELQEEQLISDLATIVDKNRSINEKGVNEEKAILKILNAFSEPGSVEKLGTPELESLTVSSPAKTRNTEKKKSRHELLLDALVVAGEKRTLFEKIYHALDDVWGTDNFTAFILLVYKYWANSSYCSDNNKKQHNGHPVVFNYDAGKLLGFYTSSFLFTFQKDNIRVSIKDQKVYLEDILIAPLIPIPRYKYFGEYHIFESVTLSRIDQKGVLKLPSRLVPAFFLKAFEDKNGVANLEKIFTVTVDILLTLTAIGNLSKLRYLRYLSLGGKAVRIVSINLELITSLLNLILDFVNDCEEGSLCDQLNKHLFWLNIALCGSNALDGLTQKMVKESAKDAADEIRKTPGIFGDKRNAVLGQLDDIAYARTIGQIKNKEYRKILEELISGKVKRVFPDMLLMEEEAVLRFYTTNAGYKNLNRALRGEIAMTEDLMLQKDLMNRALDKLPVSVYNKPGDLLYRIENLTDAQIDKMYKAGETITIKHFLSTTYSREAIVDAMRFRNYTVLIRIEGKNGRLIEGLSTLPGEKEILFKADTKFYVKEVGFEPDPDDFLKLIKRVILIEK